MLRDDRVRAHRRLRTAALTFLLASAAIGCAGPHYVSLTMEPPASSPVWVGAFLIEDKALLDDYETSDLIDQKDEIAIKKGVLNHSVFPIYPDRPAEERRFALDDVVTETAWLLVFASGPGGSCAREKRQIHESDRLDLRVSIVDDCLSVVIVQ